LAPISIFRRKFLLLANFLFQVKTNLSQIVPSRTIFHVSSGDNACINVLLKENKFINIEVHGANGVVNVIDKIAELPGEGYSGYKGTS